MFVTGNMLQYLLNCKVYRLKEEKPDSTIYSVCIEQSASKTDAVNRLANYWRLDSLHIVNNF